MLLIQLVCNFLELLFMMGGVCVCVCVCMCHPVLSSHKSDTERHAPNNYKYVFYSVFFHLKQRKTSLVCQTSTYYSKSRPLENNPLSDSVKT